MKNFFTDARHLQGLEHFLLSLFRFLVSPGSLFIHIQYLRSFHFHAKMRVHALPDVPRQNLLPSLPQQPCCFLCGMLISPWASLLLSLLLHFCPLMSAMPALSLADPSTHALAIFTFLFLLVFAKLTSVSWYQSQTDSQIPVFPLYLLFLGCKLSHSSEVL